MPRLVNFGSLNIDYVYQVPEIGAPGVTVASTRRDVYPGGKGLNQSIAAARAGADVYHVGAIGDEGQWLVDELAAAGVDVSGVERVAEATGHAVIQVDPSGQNAIVISPGSNRQISEQQVDQTLISLCQDDWILLQNETNQVDAVITQASEDDGGAKIAVNLAPADENIHTLPLDKIDLLVVNPEEAQALARVTDLEQAFSALCQAYPQLTLVMTQGRSGLRWREAGQQSQTHHMGSFCVEPVDETAAGDSFVGFLLAELLAGSNLTEALLSASAAGALAVTAAGAATSIPHRAAVQALIGREERPSISSTSSV